MKTMTCKQLGGACDQEFHANTFDELVEMSKNHGIQMFMSGDLPHQSVIAQMQSLMQSPEAFTQWMDSKRQEFDALPENA